MKKHKFADGGPMRWNTTDYASSGSAGGTNIGFKEAFRAARKQGLDNFSWRGKKYTTELPSEKSKAVEKDEAPKSKGPSTRGGSRASMQEVTVTAKRDKKLELPSDRAAGYRSQVEETGMSPEERKNAVRAGALGLATMLPAGRIARGAGAAGRSMGERGLQMAEKERTAAQMEKFRQQMQARQGLSRGSVYKSGGGVKKYASGGSVYRRAADGVAQRGKTKGSQC